MTEVAEVPVALPGWAHHGRCRALLDGRPCPDAAVWSLVLDCDRCGALGSGPACDFHKRQAEEWGIPHPDHGVEEYVQCPRPARLVSAVLL